MNPDMRKNGVDFMTASTIEGEFEFLKKKKLFCRLNQVKMVCSISITILQKRFEFIHNLRCALCSYWPTELCIPLNF